MKSNEFPELEYDGNGRSPLLGSPEDVIAKLSEIPMPPSDGELKKCDEPMIGFSEAASEIEAYKYEKLDSKYSYLHDGIKKIGDYAFCGCKNLESIVLPDGLEYIGEGAFMHCVKIENIDIPSGVNAILPYTFLGMRSLDMLSFTKSVSELHLSAFLACENLKFIVFHGSEDDWKKIKFIGDKEIFKGIYITCADDSTDKYGINAWYTRLNAYLKEGEDANVFSLTDGSRKKKFDELMAELDSIIKKL